MTNGRQKGSTAEREVAALIQPWWRQLEPDATFVRTPMSGGWGGPTVRKEFLAAGDLMAAKAPAFPFAVEVKRREGWTLQRVIDGRGSPAWEWWRQCQKAASEMGKIPMLWFRKNRAEWLVMMPTWVQGWLDPWGQTWMTVPIVTWGPNGLLGIDHGDEFPAIWRAEQLLAIPPSSVVGIAMPKGPSSSVKPPRASRKGSRRFRGDPDGSLNDSSQSPTEPSKPASSS